jgi:hypothetical protein
LAVGSLPGAAFLVSGLHESNFLFITVSGFVIPALNSILQVFAKALNCLDRVSDEILSITTYQQNAFGHPTIII